MSDIAENERLGAVEVPLTYCWLYGTVVQNDMTNDGVQIDHYNAEHPCPGPHGIMWAAR